MSTKLTPSQIKKIIKEEVQKLLLEGKAGLDSLAIVKRREWTVKNHKAFQKAVLDEMRKFTREYVTPKRESILGTKSNDNPTAESAVEFDRAWYACQRAVFPSLDFAHKLMDNVVKDHLMGEFQVNAIQAAEKLKNDGPQKGTFVDLALEAFYEVAEEKDSDVEVLDRFDGAPGRGTIIGYNALVEDVSTKAMEKIEPIFWKWLNGDLDGQKTPETPIARKKDCEKAKEIMAMIKKMDPKKVPEYIAKIIQKPTTPPGQPEFTGQIKAVAGSLNENFLASLFSGLGLAMPTMGDVKQKAKAAVAAYYNCDEVSPIEVPKKKGKGDPCIKFTKLAMQVTGANDPKLAVKTVQELLVNRGYSVIKGQTDSPFAGGGKGTAQEKDFKKLGIDGRCGQGTMGAVERFQEDNTLNPDGLVGPKTWAVLTKGLSALSSKQKQSAPASGLLGSDVQTAIRIYTYLFDQLDGDTVEPAQQVLPRLVKRGSDFSIGGKTVSDQAALVNILNQNVEKLLAMTEDELNNKLKPREGASLEPKLRLAQAKEMISKTPLQENKSYNMSFDKWSKLWE